MKSAADAATVEVEHGGRTYTVETPLSYLAVSAIDDGNFVRALKELLGPEQNKAWEATRPTWDDAASLIDAISTALGFGGGAGE